MVDRSAGCIRVKSYWSQPHNQARPRTGAASQMIARVVAGEPLGWPGADVNTRQNNSRSLDV